VVFGLILAACGGKASSRPAVVDCQAAPNAIVEAIETGLLGGTRLSRTAMVRDPERSNVWLVAGEIDGPGVEEQGDVGVWATNNPQDPGTVYAVDPYADQFSDWGRIPDPSVSEWDLARSCL
jgi:hypothetical protein